MKSFFEKFAIAPDEAAALPCFEAAKSRLAKEGDEIFNFEKYGIYTYMAKDLAAVTIRRSPPANTSVTPSCIVSTILP